MRPVSRATVRRHAASAVPACPDVLDAPGSADPGTLDHPQCPSSADSFRACHIQCHPYWAQHIQQSCHAQQLARTSLSSAQVAFQRPHGQRLAHPLPQPHQIDDSTFGTVDSDRLIRRGLNRRNSNLESLVIEAEDLCRRMTDPRRPLSSPYRDLDSSRKLISQVMDDKRRYTADDPLRDTSPNRECSWQHFYPADLSFCPISATACPWFCPCTPAMPSFPSTGFAPPGLGGRRSTSGGYS